MNKKQAAEYLGVSTRAIERYVAKGKLTPTYEPGRTGPVPIFDQAQLDAVKTEMETPVKPIAAVSDKPDKSDPDKPKRGRPKHDTAETAALALRNTFELPELLAAALRPSESLQDLNTKHLLTLAEAARLSGLSSDYLRDAIKSGKLKARKIGRGWKIKPEELKEFTQTL